MTKNGHIGDFFYGMLQFFGWTPLLLASVKILVTGMNRYELVCSLQPSFS